MNQITTPIHNEFTVQVANNEQIPYLFDGIRNDDGQLLWIPRNDAHLKTGDYSILHMENQIAIERKSHSDFLGSITEGRDRLQREFERMNKLEYGAIVVEAGWKELLIDGTNHSQVNPKTISRTITSWSIRYPRVQWWLCLDRRHAEIMTYRLLNRFWELKQGKEIP